MPPKSRSSPDTRHTACHQHARARIETHVRAVAVHAPPYTYSRLTETTRGQTLERRNLSQKEGKKDVAKDAKREAPPSSARADVGGARSGASGDAGGSRPSSVNLGEMFSGVQNMFAAHKTEDGTDKGAQTKM